MPRQVHDSIFGVEVAWVREAHRAGVPLLAGTDLGTLLTFPGSSLHEELALLGPDDIAALKMCRRPRG